MDSDCDDRLPEIPYYFGRKDCYTSPYGKAHKSFPNALRGWDESYGWFRDNFNLNQQETIALFGAHTLGKTHKHYSGFGTKTWVKDSWILNNYYYASLVYEPWWQEICNCDCEFGCKYEWHEQSGEHMMLNSDMCLMYDIHPDPAGKINCDSRTCPLQDGYIKDVTLSYARNNGLWLQDFAYSWERMITAGYDRHDLQVYHVPP